MLCTTATNNSNAIRTQAGVGRTAVGILIRVIIPAPNVGGAAADSAAPVPTPLFCKVKFSHTRYRALGPELIPVYRRR